MMPIALLCGGLATRMRPLTETVPKSLLEVAGQPFIFRQLRLLRRHGLDDAVLCTGKMGGMIRERVGDGAAFGIRVRYSDDGPRQLGTAGALKKALPLLGERFLVLYGDSYLDCDYTGVADRFLADPDAGGLMTVYRNDNRYDTSNVLFMDGRIVRYDKKNREPGMQHIDYGLGAIRADSLRDVPVDRPADLADVYTALAAAGRLAGYEVGERFYEIGSPGGLAELEARMREAGDA